MEALALALEADDSLAQLRARHAIGANRWIRGEYELAVQEFMLTLELAEVLHSPHDEGASIARPTTTRPCIGRWTTA